MPFARGSVSLGSLQATLAVMTIATVLLVSATTVFDTNVLV